MKAQKYNGSGVNEGDFRFPTVGRFAKHCEKKTGPQLISLPFAIVRCRLLVCLVPVTFALSADLTIFRSGPNFQTFGS